MEVEAVTRLSLREQGVVPLLEAILRDLPKLSGAACVGSGPLFDPRELGEPGEEVDARHTAAARLCARCPVIEQCDEWAAGEPRLRAGVIAGEVPPRYGRPGQVAS